MSKSELDVAYEYLKSEGVSIPFTKIWEHVVKETGMSEGEAGRRLSRFFTSFMLDGRFVNMGENVWDLRERQTFDRVHIDMRDVYNDVETSDDDYEEKESDEYGDIYESEEHESEEEGDLEEDEDEDSGIDFTEEEDVDVYSL
ncbi:MAG: DNA-directed RNA polymerase subunit delta [Coprobacillus sp.]|nr:DNA-directed RNA polymerase subunit delta [Coprobacillus sp.]